MSLIKISLITIFVCYLVIVLLTSIGKFEDDPLSDSSALRYWVEKMGIVKVREKLLKDPQNPECHLQAHALGAIAYEKMKGKVFAKLDSSCGSGYIHGVMEEFIKDSKTKNLISDIQEVCFNLSRRYDQDECFHGAGHGILALNDYNLNLALKICQEFGDNNKKLCFAGVFMENIMGHLNLSKVSGHEIKWVENDPYYPCNSLGKFQDDKTVQALCYSYQASIMLNLTGNDFNKTAQLCKQASIYGRENCFYGLGKEVYFNYPNNPQEAVKICSIDPTYLNSCVAGVLKSMVDMHDESLSNIPDQFCRGFINQNHRLSCYLSLGKVLSRIFETDEVSKANICSFAQEEYRQMCLKTK